MSYSAYLCPGSFGCFECTQQISWDAKGKRGFLSRKSNERRYFWGIPEGESPGGGRHYPGTCEDRVGVRVRKWIRVRVRVRETED
eukprot:1395529-Amorphochlora_amoeboformis.AAC.1